MDEPRSELKTSVDDQTIPDFGALTAPEEVVSGGRTRDDFFGAVLGLDSFVTTKELANLAGRGVDAVREYFQWFEQMGIVTRVTDSPATYERNQAYFNWRRVQTLRREYAPETLVEFLKTESKRSKPNLTPPLQMRFQLLSMQKILTNRLRRFGSDFLSGKQRVDVSRFSNALSGRNQAMQLISNLRYDCISRRLITLQANQLL